MGEEAFSDVKVLDCTEGVAGPYCSKWLADFGAEVIKVEKPGEGDIARRMGPFPGDEPNPEKSGAFFYLNTNKKSITLNLRSETGVKILKELVKRSDILVEDFGPGILSELGLSDEMLKEVNPRLIVTSVSDFGQTGPYRRYKATNLTLHGLGGTMYTSRPTHEPMNRPVVEGGLQAEYTTGLLSFIATVGALVGRTRSDKGTRIDISAIESVASTLTMHFGEYSCLGVSKRTNLVAIHGYPNDYYRCKDGWMNTTPGIGGAPSIPLLMGKPELQDAPLFAKPSARMVEPEKFDAVVLPWLEKQPKWETTKQAQELRLAFTPVLTPGDLLEDEQLKAREFFAEANHPVMGDVTYAGAPAKLSETRWRPGRVPLLGEHNAEIYGDLGYSREDLVRLREEGLI